MQRGGGAGGGWCTARRTINAIAMKSEKDKNNTKSEKNLWLQWTGNSLQKISTLLNILLFILLPSKQNIFLNYYDTDIVCI